jgi:hypothetical protein
MAAAAQREIGVVIDSRRSQKDVGAHDGAITRLTKLQKLFVKAGSGIAGFPEQDLHLLQQRVFQDARLCHHSTADASYQC